MSPASSPRDKKRAPGRAGALALAAVVLGAGVALTGCGPSTSAAVTTAPASTGGVATPTTPGTTPSNTSSEIAPTAQAALCTAAMLSASLDDTGGGAAGSIYLKLIVTNKSAATCLLDGYPGVSLVKAGPDTPLGAPADRDAKAPSSGPIALAPGRSATAVLQYSQAGKYPNCRQVQADSIMVYPPGATDRLVIARPLTACNNAGDHLLTIGAFQP